MKRFLTIFLVLCLLIPLPVWAADRGTWGENMAWHFEGETLTVTGSDDGKMADFAAKEDAPWYIYKDQVKKLVFVDVSYIGARAFTDYDALTEIDFGEKLYEIGEQAFMGCDGLVDLTMPKSFKVFGPECFRGCKNMRTITCLGRFPSFRLNCLWDVYVKILYPPENQWHVNEVQNLETAFKGRIEFLTTQGDDPNPPPTSPETTPPETTPAPTTPAPTVPPETVPEVTVTVPVVTAPPQTTPQITTSAQTTPAPTTPPQASPEENARSTWTGAAIILAVLSAGGLLAGLVSLRKDRRRHRRRRR